jgi:DNA-binding beta-propeller fold protein YncE
MTDETQDPGPKTQDPGPKTQAPRPQGPIAAPSLDGATEWLNVVSPIALSQLRGKVVLLDFWNHKIKMLDPASGTVTTIAGTGQAGHVDGPASRAQFYEPGGLSVAGHIVYVADTNNHAIRTIDLQSATVSTLTFEGLAPPAAWSYLRQK